MPNLSYVLVELEDASPETIREVLNCLHMEEGEENTVQAAGLFGRIGQARKLFDLYNKFKAYLPLLTEFSDLLDFSGDLTAGAIEAKLSRFLELAKKVSGLTSTTMDDWAVGVLLKIEDAGLLSYLAELIADRISSGTPGAFSHEKAEFEAAGIDPGSVMKLVEILAGLFSMAKAIWPAIEDLLKRFTS